MLTVVKNSENSRIISIPADEMEKLGINDGDEVEFTKKNDEIILRQSGETDRKRKFEKAKNEIFEKWHDVFVELAKGADDKTIKSVSIEKFVLFQTESENYKFILQNAGGQIIFTSSDYSTKQEAYKAIDSLKQLVSTIKGKATDFPVESK